MIICSGDSYFSFTSSWQTARVFVSCWKHEFTSPFTSQYVLSTVKISYRPWDQLYPSTDRLKVTFCLLSTSRLQCQTQRTVTEKVNTFLLRVWHSKSTVDNLPTSKSIMWMCICGVCFTNRWHTTQVEYHLLVFRYFVSIPERPNKNHTTVELEFMLVL